MIARRVVMLVLMVAAVASGQVATSRPSTADVTTALAVLPRMNRPIYWTDATDVRSSWITQDEQAMAQLARVCGTVCVAGEWLEDEAWQRAMKVRYVYGLKVGVNCWPWARKSVPRTAAANGGVDPRTDEKSPWVMSELIYMRSWINAVAERARASKVTIDCVMVDFETWRCNTDPELRKLRQFSQLLRDAFPQAVQEWYCAGRRAWNDYGWRTDSYGGEWVVTDIASCNLYTLGEWFECLEDLRQTRAYWRRPYVTPWLSLGCYYKRGWTVRDSDRRPVITDVWTEKEGVPSWACYRTGSWLIKREYDRAPYVGNGDVRHVVLHPRPGSVDHWWANAVQFLYGAVEMPLPERWR